MSGLAREKFCYSLHSIDLLARAVFTWVRQDAMDRRFSGVPVPAEEQYKLAAGFLAGLRTRFELLDSDAELVAYAYALMTGERFGAAALAGLLIERDSHVWLSCSEYLRAMRAARTLISDLEWLEKGLVIGSSADESVDFVPATLLN